VSATPGTDAPNVAEVLQRMAGRMTSLAQDTKRLEDVAGRRLVGDGTASAELVMELQSLDHLHQALNDMAALTTWLGTLPFTCDVSPDMHDAIRPALKMSATQALLSPEQQTHQIDKDQANGDAQLF